MNPELTRKVSFSPAFDRRDPNPKKNYGIHGVNINFSVVGPAGGVTYTIYTNWQLPHVQAETDAKELFSGSCRYMFHKPLSAGLNGHWKVPRYEGQSSIANCKITGGDCYCGGTSLTEDLFNRFVAEGDSAIWQTLEERYEDWKPK